MKFHRGTPPPLPKRFPELALASALGQLALQVMDKGDFGFSIQEAFALSLINKSLFQLANKIGFLKIVSRNAETNEPLYAFFHRTFQEYFAALAIDDWHFFLNHIPDNPSLGTYRIFEPQWKEVIWFGWDERMWRKSRKRSYSMR